MSNCDEFGPLISAMLDGEISASERLQVDAHLANCGDCRRRAKAFQEIDSHAAGAEIELSEDVRTRVVRRLEPSIGLWVAGKFGNYAAAAAVLVALASAFWLFRGDPVDAEEILDPLMTLQVITRQEERTYAALRESLQWELRTLRLDVEQLQLEQDKTDRLNERIDELIQRVEQSITSEVKKGETT